MEIVINEWLLEYLRPDAQESDKRQAVHFLNVFLRKRDMLVVKRSSPFVDKFYRFMKQFGSNTAFKKNFSKLNNILFRDADKTIIVDENDLRNLPDDITDKTPVDDLYLIELWYAKKERIVLTTDVRLKEKLKDVSGLNICLLSEFLQDYYV
jgi:hypothetical protein